MDSRQKPSDHIYSASTIDSVETEKTEDFYSRETLETFSFSPIIMIYYMPVMITGSFRVPPRFHHIVQKPKFWAQAARRNLSEEAKHMF